jgi:hypothetical protein
MAAYSLCNMYDLIDLYLHTKYKSKFIPMRAMNRFVKWLKGEGIQTGELLTIHRKLFARCFQIRCAVHNIKYIDDASTQYAQTLIYREPHNKEYGIKELRAISLCFVVVRGQTETLNNVFNVCVDWFFANRLNAHSILNDELLRVQVMLDYAMCKRAEIRWKECGYSDDNE